MRIVHLIICVFLSGVSIYDVRFHQISVKALLAGGVFAAVSGLIPGGPSWQEMAAGGMMGVLLLGLGKVTHEAIGYGDGWIVAELGICLGFWAILEVLAAAWILLAIVSGIVLVRKRWSPKAALPVTPFLTAGFLFYLTGLYLG